MVKKSGPPTDTSATSQLHWFARPAQALIVMQAYRNLLLTSPYQV